MLDTIIERLSWSLNRKYKDRLFRRVFREKKDLLSLYNAINGTSYENENDLEITTLENVIFMSMKNDVSFIVSSTMNLYEHQSTINNNMPLRGLLYFARLYDNYIKSRDMDIYGHKQVQLPMPQFIVFYNGGDDFPDQQILRLSDAFIQNDTSINMEPAIECKARVINVNYGRNKELMEKCTRLLHYSMFIEMVNRNIEKGMTPQTAIELAIDVCIEKGILVDILIKNRGEVSHMLLTEFDQKKYRKTVWQEGHDIGVTNTLDIITEINQGNRDVDSLVKLGYDRELVEKILQTYK